MILHIIMSSSFLYTSSNEDAVFCVLRRLVWQKGMD